MGVTPNPATEVAAIVKEHSSDDRNHSMEFNEFLKMMAAEERRDLRPQREALVDAFRSTLGQLAALCHQDV